MRNLIVAVLVVGFVFTLGLSLHSKTPDGMPPSEEVVCDGLKGAAFGLCNAYCEAMDCDSEDPNASEKACEKVLANYQKKTDVPIPCIDLCEDVECGLEQECVDGICLCAGAECADGEVCIDETCQPPECTADEECPQFEICEDGRCILGCSVILCLPGTVCERGQCIPATCPNVPCEDGEVCIDGECCLDGPAACGEVGECIPGDNCVEPSFCSEINGLPFCCAPICNL